MSSSFISAYRKSFSIEHVLIKTCPFKAFGRLEEELPNNNVAGAVLTGLSMAFDCIIHDLLKDKLGASSFCRETVAFIYSYLKSRKQCIRINGTQSYLGDMISGVS